MIYKYLELDFLPIEVGCMYISVFTFLLPPSDTQLDLTKKRQNEPNRPKYNLFDPK